MAMITDTMREIAKDLDQTLKSAIGRASIAAVLGAAADEIDKLRSQRYTVPPLATVPSNELSVQIPVSDTSPSELTDDEKGLTAKYGGSGKKKK